MKKNKTFLLLLIFVSMILQSIAQNTGTLIIEIGSFRNDNGQVAVSIHNGEKGFPGGEESMVQAKYAPIKNGKAIVEFSDLPFGAYGVSAYHDENANEEMDTNWIGIPKEGVGASNNAKGRMGPPKYEDAKFDFKEDKQKIQFEISYF